MRKLAFTRVLITLLTLFVFCSFMDYITVLGVTTLKLSDILQCIISFILTSLGGYWLVEEFCND